MWPFKKNEEEELQELKVPYQEAQPQEDLSTLTVPTDKQDLINSKLDTIIAKLESIEQRLRNLER